MKTQSRKLPWRIHLFSYLCLLGLIGLLSLGRQTAVAQTTQNGTITGTVRNGSTDEPVAAGTIVTLNAYNNSFTNAETLTTAVAADGRFQFTLSDKPADWVYMVSTTYQELSFSSNIVKLAADQSLDLPLTVYESTSDPANIIISNLQISLNFVGQEAQVSELYTVSNEATAVFTGGSEGAGTVQINLPESAQSPSFERGMGPNSGYFPATEFIQQDGRWYDTLALRPGPNGLTLRVTYSLPLADAFDLSRQLPYQTKSVTVALPDGGLDFAADGWQQQASQSAGENGVFLNYTREGLMPNSELALTFSGTAAFVPATASTSSTAGDWIISLGIVLLIATIALRLLRPRKNTVRLPQLATAGPAPLRPETDKAERRQLLSALADLDIAYQSGQLAEAAYQQQRQDIKNRLRNIWEIV